MALEIVALILATISLAIASVAYWRSGGAQDIGRLRSELVETGDELRTRLRGGYEEALRRIDRARALLAEIPPQVSASVRASIDSLNKELSTVRHEVEQELQRLKTSVSASSQAARDAVATRVRRLEGRVRLLVARGEMARAESLAERGELAAAEDLLEDALMKVREVQRGLGPLFEDDPAFAHLLAALRQAIRSVRTRAESRKREIEELIAESDNLLHTLEAA
jgi:chromosome segregation ATPase